MPMDEIKIFENEQFGKVRIAMSESNDPLFCLADVCRVIGITNARNVRSRLEEDDVRQMDTIDSLGRNQQVTFITESGLYDVIIRSESEKAKPFRKWVTSEVLPSIRKHGVYLTNETLEKALLSPDYLIKLATQIKEERQKRIEAEKKVAEAAPSIAFTNAVQSSNTSCLIGELAKLIAQNGYPIGEKRLFAWLRENGYLGKHGERYNIPNQQYIEQGLFELKKGVRSGNGGVLHTTITPKITGKGQVYFVNKFLRNQ
jgi:anti-repressor protein